MTALVLGCDPGLVNFGWALVRVSPTLSLERCGVITTTNAPKLTASSDNVQRARRVDTELQRIVEYHGAPSLICCEAFSYPQNARSAVMMAFGWGAIVALANDRDLPVLQASHQRIKRQVAGNRRATKDQVGQALQSLFPAWDRDIPRSKREHAGDALGAVVALVDDPAMKRLRLEVGAA